MLRGGYILFWLGDRIAKFKIHQIKNYDVWAKSPNLIPAKFPAMQYMFVNSQEFHSCDFT